MFHKLIISFLIVVFLTLSQTKLPFAMEYAYSSNEHVLAKHQMSLNTRYPDEGVNRVFKENILLTLSYLSGEKQFTTYELVLQPGEVFAFHDDVLPEYRNKVIKTTHAHFNSQEGFLSDGYLVGDGVCHLASLITWTAKDAGLGVLAPTNHDFANIPEVPKEYGTAIVTTGAPSLTAERQNLYLENTFDKPVRMVFRYENNDVSITVYK